MKNCVLARFKNVDNEQTVTHKFFNDATQSQTVVGELNINKRDIQ